MDLNSSERLHYVASVQLLQIGIVLPPFTIIIHFQQLSGTITQQKTSPTGLRENPRTNLGIRLLQPRNIKKWPGIAIPMHTHTHRHVHVHVQVHTLMSIWHFLLHEEITYKFYYMHIKCDVDTNLFKTRRMAFTFCQFNFHLVHC
jgi:hypothetical protein